MREKSTLSCKEEIYKESLTLAQKCGLIPGPLTYKTHFMYVKIDSQRDEWLSQSQIPI